MTHALNVRLGVAFEDGCNSSPEEVTDFVQEMHGCCVVGIYLEDGEGSRELLATKFQAIQSRQTLTFEGMLIEARTDVYLRAMACSFEAVELVRSRARQFAQAGADGLSVPGLADADKCARVMASTELRLTLMVVPGLPSAESLGPPGRKPERQLHVLHRRAGCAFAQIVEDRGQQHLAAVGTRVNGHAKTIAAVQGLGVQAIGANVLVQRLHFDEGLTRVAGVKRGVQALGRNTAAQKAQVQRDRQHNALAIVAVRRKEDRRLRQPGVALDLGYVLVVQAQAVDLKRQGLRIRVTFVLVQPGSAASRVARYCVNGQRVVGRQQACVDQGPQQGHRTRGVATRIADASGGGNAPRL